MVLEEASTCVLKNQEVLVGRPRSVHAGTAAMYATPTGNDGFLDRLAQAEARDSHRGERGGPSTISMGNMAGQLNELSSAELGERLQGKARVRTSRLTFHPQVVTNIEDIAGDFSSVEARKSIGDISGYSPAETQEVLSRQMVKMHLNEVKKVADPVQRRTVIAHAADEAWMRADTLRQELQQEGLARPIGGETLRERQTLAARRCAAQMSQLDEKRTRQRPRAPLARAPGQNGGGRPPRGASPRRASPNRASHATLPARGQSPRASASPRRAPSPRPAPYPGRVMRTGGLPPRGGAPAGVRTSTRVSAPPGGGSSIVFG